MSQFRFMSSDDDLLVSYARNFANQNEPVQNDGEIPSTWSSSVPPSKKIHRRIVVIVNSSESSDDDEEINAPTPHEVTVDVMI
jgi:hypothetical protein